jgi:transcriptional regulator with XRE-family HTH domain
MIVKLVKICRSRAFIINRKIQSIFVDYKYVKIDIDLIKFSIILTPVDTFNPDKENIKYIQRDKNSRFIYLPNNYLKALNIEFDVEVEVLSDKLILKKLNDDIKSKFNLLEVFKTKFDLLKTKNRVTLNDIEKSTGIKKNHLSAVLNGRLKLNLDVVENIANYFNVTPVYMFLDIKNEQYYSLLEKMIENNIDINDIKKFINSCENNVM